MVRRRFREFEHSVLRNIADGMEQDLPHVHQGEISSVSGQHSLPATDEISLAKVIPVSFSGHKQSTVGTEFGANVPGGDQADHFATIRPCEMGGRPDDISEVNRRLDIDLSDSMKGDPVVGAVDDSFEYRSESGICIGKPFEGLIIDGSRRHRSQIEGLYL